MFVAIIGMTGVGKTFWSKKLEKNGWYRFCCDDYIEQRLAQILVPLGYSGTADVAKWMGQPYESQHAQSSRQYLQLEEESIREVARLARDAQKNPCNFVVDTTGSIVYVASQLLDMFRSSFRIVYLAASEGFKDELLRRYIAHPKPVVWGDSYQPKPGEKPKDALARCYAHLLAYRSKRYAALAHVTIPHTQHQREDFDLLSFLNSRV
jgi:shikimate kinase